MTTTQPNRARAALGMAPAAAAAAPGTAVVPSIEKRIAECRAAEQAFTDAVAQGLSPQTLIRDAITAVRTTPKLAECTKDSFFGALMTAAQLGLRPNVASLGHGWVLPRWNGRKQVNEASWQLGYQGMVELGYRSRLVQKITAHTIYEGEPHRISWGTQDVLEHEPVQDAAQRGNVLWHYAVVWLATGGVVWNAITDAEARDTMNAYAGKDRQGNVVGPWVQNYLPMARKTALRGLWRYMPKTPELSLALATDEVVREGMAKDPAVGEAEPEREREHIDVQPAGEPGAAASEPVDADVVPDPPEPTDDVPPADEPPAEPEPEPEATHTMADGTVRKAFDDNQARRAYATRALTQHGDVEGVRRALVAMLGEPLPAQYLSTAEMKKLADHEPVPAPTDDDRG